MNNNIKDIIKIPKELDNAVLKGFEKGKREKKRAKQKVIFKRSAIAAGIIVAGTTMAGMINPELVSAIPIVGDVFEYFNDGVYKQASDKYEELGKDVNVTIEDNGVKVTLNKVIIDDNILVASLLVESDKFIGYDEWRSPQDFLNTDLNILINGEIPSSWSPKVTIVNESTAAIILEANVSHIKIGNEVNIDLDINNFTRGRKTLAKGNWDFNIKTIKGSESNIYEVNKSLKLTDEEINIEKLVITPLNNRLTFSGITDDYENFRADENKFIIRDNSGKILLLDFTSGSVSNKGQYEYSYNILNDLGNTEYIEVIKVEGNTAIEREINGFNEYLLKASSSDESNANRSNEIISREPTKEELSDGYALSSVNYNVDIDRDNAFENIDSLIGKEIAVNNTDKIIVKDIVTHDDYTEVVMKIDGSYNYRLLSGMVLFDEDMNDACAFEGATTVLNDIEEKIVTVKLTKIDPSKKYTIAIPVTTDLVIDENEKVTINLK
ncbi:DUF4179 domain-containing protein [uncultured Clostridium sp.]|uniref:DUF4179 domain-containing protein n=1 Tax=uncultured Clostridium sp. TaxID=59620 RepID=UPI0025D85FFE|nr:DUF4179 domain-containing protein [uncultured Clostridium sp.]